MPATPPPTAGSEAAGPPSVQPLQGQACLQKSILNCASSDLSRAATREATRHSTAQHPLCKDHRGAHLQCHYMQHIVGYLTSTSAAARSRYPTTGAGGGCDCTLNRIFFSRTLLEIQSILRDISHTYAKVPYTAIWLPPCLKQNADKALRPVSGRGQHQVAVCGTPKQCVRAINSALEAEGQRPSKAVSAAVALSTSNMDVCLGSRRTTTGRVTSKGLQASDCGVLQGFQGARQGILCHSPQYGCTSAAAALADVVFICAAAGLAPSCHCNPSLR